MCCGGTIVTGVIALVFGIIVVILVLAIVFVVGMRTRWGPVVNTVRRMNRAFMNPRQMRSAGTPGAYASIIRHRGRKSGKDYETPVVPVADADGFVIVLPYGPSADWVKNVLASGSATIVHEGQTYAVDEPEVISTDAVSGLFSPAENRQHRLVGVDQCLRVRVVNQAETTGSGIDQPEP
jgi:deazaflavin-dependent oxidoreductase (nitroreductase family)